MAMKKWTVPSFFEGTVHAGISQHFIYNPVISTQHVRSYMLVMTVRLSGWRSNVMPEARSASTPVLSGSAVTFGLEKTFSIDIDRSIGYLKL